MVEANIMGDWITEAAESLIRSLRAEGVPEKKLASFITVQNLASYCHCGQRTVRKALKARYSAQLEKFKEESSFSVPPTQFLRKELGIYEGNLEDAIKKWPNVVFSKFDLIRSLRIPTQIGEVEAMLLGVFYADGNLILENGENGRRRATLYGTAEDFTFYKKWVAPALKQAFNLEAKLKPRGTGPFVYDGPGIEMKSEALFTWLHHHMQFPIGRRGITVPNFQNGMIVWNVLKGVIAAEGMIYVDEEKSVMRITDANREYVSSIANLARIFHFECSERQVGDVFMLEFGKTQIKEMLRRGIIVNPYHEEVTLPFAREILEYPTDYKGLSRADFLLFTHLYKSNVQTGDIERHFGLEEGGSRWYVAKAYRLDLLKRKRGPGTLPKSKAVPLDVALANYTPPDENVPMLVAFMHNCNVGHQDIKRHLGIKSVGQELNKARRLGLNVLNTGDNQKYMQRDVAQVAEIYRKTA